jgi:hypothetical protein
MLYYYTGEDTKVEGDKSARSLLLQASNTCDAVHSCPKTAKPRSDNPPLLVLKAGSMTLLPKKQTNR